MLKFASEVNIMLGYGIPKSELQMLILLGTSWLGGGKVNRRECGVNAVSEKCFEFTIRKLQWVRQAYFPLI